MGNGERIVRGFKLLEVIGRGGMAVVYKAVQLSVNRVVAVKELHRHFLADPEFIDRFKREATAAANLHHENIIIIHDYGAEEQDGKVTSYIIAMEYVEGRSLKDLMEGGKRIPVPVALNIAVQICRGLEHAHTRGVIHRDIKPANIMISNDGYVKIADFGLAQSSHLPSMTVTGVTLGTPAYMSPEQVAGNRKLDGRTDIFSLGVVMYEMVTGQKPFIAETYPAIMTKILTHNPESPSSLNPAVPEDFSRIIMKCLAKDVDKRYRDVGDLLKELQFCAERNDIRIEGGILREFVKDPDEFERRLNAILVKQYIDRGLYYMNLGFEKFDDAITMFTKALQIDPDNPVAKENLERLRKEKEKSEVKLKKVEEKVVIEEKPVVIVKRGSSAWIYILTGVLFIGTLAIGGFFVFKSRTITVKEEAPAPSKELVKEKTEETTLITEKPQEKVESVETSEADKGKIVETKIESKEKSERKIVRTTPKVDEEKVVKESRESKESKENVASLPPPQPEEKVVEYSYLMVLVSPWADVYIDDKLVARTPLKEPIKIPAGEHTVKLVNPEYTPFERKINFKPRPKDKPLIIQISLEPIGAK